MKLALDVMMALAILLTLLILTRLVALKGMRVLSLGRRFRYVLVLVFILVSLLTMGAACESDPYSPGTPNVPAPQPTICGVSTLETPIPGYPVATVCTGPYQ